MGNTLQIVKYNNNMIIKIILSNYHTIMIFTIRYSPGNVTNYLWVSVGSCNILGIILLSHQSCFLYILIYLVFVLSSKHTSKFISVSCSNSIMSRTFAGMWRINDFGLVFDLFLTFVKSFIINVIFYASLVYCITSTQYNILPS